MSRRHWLLIKKMFHWKDNYTNNKRQSLLCTQFCNNHHMQMPTFASQIPWTPLENGHSLHPYCFHHSLNKLFSVTLLPASWASYCHGCSSVLCPHFSLERTEKVKEEVCVQQADPQRYWNYLGVNCTQEMILVELIWFRFLLGERLMT